MSSAGRKLVHSCQVPFLAGSPLPSAQAGAGSGGAGVIRADLAVTARNACASMARVMCRYQARYLRTW